MVVAANPVIVGTGKTTTNHTVITKYLLIYFD